MASFIQDEQSAKWCGQLIRQFNGEFGFIDPDHVTVVRDTSSQTSRCYANTSLVPAHYQPLVPYRIMIRTYECNYGQLGKAAKILIMHHELKHVGEKQNGSGYKMIHHDVEDFAEMLNQYGIGWAARKDLPNILVESLKKSKVKK